MIGKTSLVPLFLSMLTGTAVAREYNMVTYGAKADTTVLSTKALQQAIDDCSKAGGGRVIVPTGNYKIGSVVLKSNVHLYLEQGATLYGSTDLKDYLPMKSDYVSLRTQTSTIQLIYADKVKNVVIDGYGTIDGRGRAFKKLSWNDEGITRPHLIRFIQSEDITVKDITLKNAGCWMQHYLACDRVRIEDIKVFNRNNYNNDALDIDGCQGVIVKGVVADSDDDGITLKSTSPRLCENIRISDCVISSHCNAVKLGTETNGGFRNISISGIVVKPSSDQSSQFFGAPSKKGTSALSLEIVDGGVMENVSAADFTVEGTESPIFIRLGNRGRGYQLKKTAKGLSGKGNDDMITELIPMDHVGTIDGIRIHHFQVRNAGPVGCSITGLAGHPVRNVWLSDISIHQQGGVKDSDLQAIRDSLCNEKEKSYPEATMWGNLPAKGFYLRHTRNIHFENVTIQTSVPDARPDYVRIDTEGWGDQGDGTYRNPVLNVDFSDPYYESGLTMVVREDEQNIKTFSDLKGKKIAVQIGTTSAKEAKKIEGAEVKELNTPADCFMELKNGGVDAVVNDRPVNDYYIHKSGQTGVKTLPERLTSEDYGIAVAKGNKELAEKINAALKKLKENGEYDKIFAKWFGAQK